MTFGVILEFTCEAVTLSALDPLTVFLTLNSFMRTSSPKSGRQGSMNLPEHLPYGL